MKTKLIKQILVVVAGIILAIGCDRNRVYESYAGIGDRGWHKDSVLLFQFEIHDTLQAHNLYVNIRNKGNYPNSNIWLFLSVVSPAGEVVADTVEFMLADASGRWFGSGIGDLFDNQFPYRSNILFPSSGTYEIRIHHGMRVDLLKGIRDVGIRVEKRP